jgi:hypothetical protein
MCGDGATKIGRPTFYTDELADTICQRIAEGETLVKICKDATMPSYRTVLNWRSHIPAFKVKYDAAREDAADTLADELKQIALDVREGRIDPQAGRVAIDAFKWMASKLKPKSYGDRLETHMTHSASSALLDAMEALGNRGLPGDKSKVIDAVELPSTALPRPK